MNDAPSEQETKIVYRQGDRLRALRGILVSENDAGFLVLERRDGTFKIRSELVVEIFPARFNGGELHG